MIKLKLEHGRPFGNDNNSYALRMSLYNEERDNFCDSIFAAPYLKKLDENELNDLCTQIEFCYAMIMKNLLGLSNNGTPYDPAIAKHIKEQLKK